MDKNHAATVREDGQPCRNMETIEDLLNKSTTMENHREVVRLRTSYWSDKGGVHMKKSLTRMRRKSVGSFELLNEDASMVGGDAVWEKIVNLHECRDGLYIFTTCNERRDWETGIVDDYDYKLLPYNENEPT